MVEFTKHPVLMGVVNVTPDSFSDGGDFINVEHAVAHGIKLVEEGAQILDIGGESTRPGALPVSVAEEQARVLPVIEGLKKAGVKAQISIDTRNAETMQKSIELGIDIINDISALTHDIDSLDVVSKAQIQVILMHAQGAPQTMQDKPEYNDVVSEVFNYLQGRIDACLAAGIKRENIVCDPGVGFGKALEDNLKILKNIKEFQELNCPILLGSSRKSFIEKISPNTLPKDRLAGSLSSALWGYQNGVQMFRVHDVRETKQAFDVFDAISNVK